MYPKNSKSFLSQKSALFLWYLVSRSEYIFVIFCVISIANIYNNNNNNNNNNNDKKIIINKQRFSTKGVITFTNDVDSYEAPH